MNPKPSDYLLSRITEDKSVYNVVESFLNEQRIPSRTDDITEDAAILSPVVMKDGSRFIDFEAKSTELFFDELQGVLSTLANATTEENTYLRMIRVGPRATFGSHIRTIANDAKDEAELARIRMDASKVLSSLSKVRSLDADGRRFKESLVFELSELVEAANPTRVSSILTAIATAAFDFAESLP